MLYVTKAKHRLVGEAELGKLRLTLLLAPDGKLLHYTGVPDVVFIARLRIFTVVNCGTGTTTAFKVRMRPSASLLRI